MVYPSAIRRIAVPAIVGSNCSVVLLACFVAGVAGVANAQSPKPAPWQSAPALPAQLPTQQSSGAVAYTPLPGGQPTGQQRTQTVASPDSVPVNRIVSLPAPPASRGPVASSSPRNTQPTAAPQGLMLPPLPVGPVTQVPNQAAGPAAMGLVAASPDASGSGPTPFLPTQNPPQQAQNGPLPGGGFPGAKLPAGLPPGQLGQQPVANQTQNTGQPAPPVARPLKGGELVAVVGTEHVLAGDMSVFVDPIIEKNRDKLPSQAAVDQLRTQLTRQVLKQYIEIKAMYLEFFRDMVGTKPPSELDAMKEQVVTRATKIFYEKQVPTLYDRYKVKTPVELERKLAEKSLSLTTMRNQFIEQVLSAEYENKYIPRRFEISRRELLDYYRAHASEWNMKARAKWREISIRFDRHDPATAKTLIDNLHRQIFLGGKPFDAVARESSEGFTASDGGMYDWTTQGSLKSKVIEQAIFTQPLRRLSAIIQDDVGLHIIEVLEREDAHVKSFPDAQEEIREIISRQKSEKAKEKLRSDVLKRTPVWTLWPEDLKDLPRVHPLTRTASAP